MTHRTHEPIRVFLAGIIQGSKVETTIHDQDWREPLKRICAEHLPAADVYCHYTQHPNSIQYDLPMIRATLEEGNRKAAESDLLIAYLPSASMGTAIELYEAARRGAATVTVTPMYANWIVRAYSDQICEDLDAFETFAGGGDLSRLLERKRRG